MKLEGKVAIVTGAGSIGEGIGIGKAIAVTLAEGAQVALVDKSRERAEVTQAMIEEEGGEGAVLEIDLTEVTAGRQIVDATVDRFGGVDILVNNAAVPGSVSLLDTPEDLFQEMLAVNVAAPFRPDPGRGAGDDRSGRRLDRVHHLDCCSAGAGWFRGGVRDDQIGRAGPDGRRRGCLRHVGDPMQLHRTRDHHDAPACRGDRSRWSCAGRL